MFLLLMPIFAAPWEALAAFMFMAAGVPMYYLTALSRSRQGASYSRMDGQEGGILATLQGMSTAAHLTPDAWYTFLDDLSRLLPKRWSGTLQRRQETQEQHSMLPERERLEMSEL